MDLGELLAKKRRRAVQQVRTALAAIDGIEEMRVEDLNVYGASEGWTCKREIGEKELTLDLTLPKRFPFDPPQVWARGMGKALSRTNSHVTSKDGLCLFAENVGIAIDAPGAVAVNCLARAEKVLREGDASGFSTEFSSHWSRASGDDAPDIILIDSPKSLLDGCEAVVTEKLVFVGRSKDSLEKWLANYLGKDRKLPYADPAYAVPLEAAITPNQYPSSVNELLDLLKARHPEGASWLLDRIADSTESSTVVLVQGIASGPALAGIGVPPLQLARQGRLHDGFRKGRAPAALLYARAPEARRTALAIQRVRRADHQWVHSRGGDGRCLAQFSVCLIGCGSLGGYVAHLIGRSGISRMSLVDCDVLDWDNVGRHVLGANDVYRGKARALAEKLGRELPHLELQPINLDWRDWAEGDSSAIANHDLVISTTGDWRAEHALNEMVRRYQAMPGLLFGWLEPFGVAGHALSVRRIGGCLNCGMDSLGRFRHRVAAFSGDTLIQEAAGCEYYQQYGPVALMPIASMVAEAAIEALEESPITSELRTWVAREEVFRRSDAKVTPGWSPSVTGSGFGRIYSQAWTKSKDCKLCE